MIGGRGSRCRCIMSGSSQIVFSESDFDLTHRVLSVMLMLVRVVWVSIRVKGSCLVFSSFNAICLSWWKCCCGPGGPCGQSGPGGQRGQRGRFAAESGSHCENRRSCLFVDVGFSRDHAYCLKRILSQINKSLGTNCTGAICLTPFGCLVDSDGGMGNGVGVLVVAVINAFRLFGRFRPMIGINLVPIPGATS